MPTAVRYYLVFAAVILAMGKPYIENKSMKIAVVPITQIAR
jgi:hypothetical protein